LDFFFLGKKKWTKCYSRNFFNGGSTTGYIYFPAGNGLQVEQYDGGEQYSLVTSKLYRDVSAWYHIVISS
jgi:hypothetical protein